MLHGVHLRLLKSFYQQEFALPTVRFQGHFKLKQPYESEWTLGVGDGQGGLACCDPWGRKESDTTERLNRTELKQFQIVIVFYLFLYFPGIWKGILRLFQNGKFKVKEGKKSRIWPLFCISTPCSEPPPSPAKVIDPSGLFTDISASTLAVPAHMVFTLCYSSAWNSMMGLHHGWKPQFFQQPVSLCMFCIYLTPTPLVSFYTFLSQRILLAFVLVLEQSFPVCAGHHYAWIISVIRASPFNSWLQWLGKMGAILNTQLKTAASFSTLIPLILLFFKIFWSRVLIAF